MPFGIKKSEADADLDGKKASLFGRKKLTKSPPQSQNPYAAQAPSTNNPYAAPAPSTNANPYATAPQPSNNNPYAAYSNNNDPYAKQSQSSFSQPAASSFGNLTLNSQAGTLPSYRASSPQPPKNRYEKSPVPRGGYGGSGGGRFPTSAGPSQAAGYSDNPYGGGESSSHYGAGGYGGMGRTKSQDTMGTDVGRNALFGDAPQRAAQHEPGVQQQEGGDNSYTAAGGYSNHEMQGGYGAPVPDRELTAEEQEEQDVTTAKQEIRFIKQQDVSSTRNIRRMAEEMSQTTDSTLMRLGQQGERIHNTERNLDSASNQNRVAEEKARELRTLNRSMFAVHVANPFTAKRREEAANSIALEKHQREREQRDETAAFAYQSQSTQERQRRDVNGNAVRKSGPKNLADRAKYQFEADESDEEKEAEIEENL